MDTLNQIETRVLQLPESDRARLALQLLDSLPSMLSDEDEGVAEALRRSAELDRDPSAGMTLEELHRGIRA